MQSGFVYSCPWLRIMSFAIEIGPLRSARLRSPEKLAKSLVAIMRLSLDIVYVHKLLITSLFMLFISSKTFFLLLYHIYYGSFISIFSTTQDTKATILLGITIAHSNYQHRAILKPDLPNGSSSSSGSCSPVPSYAVSAKSRSATTSTLRLSLFFCL